MRLIALLLSMWPYLTIDWVLRVDLPDINTVFIWPCDTACCTLTFSQISLNDGHVRTDGPGILISLVGRDPRGTRPNLDLIRTGLLIIHKLRCQALSLARVCLVPVGIYHTDLSSCMLAWALIGTPLCCTNNLGGSKHRPTKSKPRTSICRHKKTLCIQPYSNKR